MQHGTVNAYRNLGCRCDRCRSANTRYCQERRSKETRRCTLKDCDRVLYAKGLCKSHYDNPSVNTNRQGEIYAIQEGSDGPIKIGFATTPSHRMVILQSGNSRTLRMLTTVAGTINRERSIQRKLKKHKIRGEWFKPHREVLAEIASWN